MNPAPVSPCACGPLCEFASVRKCSSRWPVREQGGGWGAGGAQPALALAARGFPAMLGLRSHRETRCTHCVRCARTLAVSQLTKRAGTRADLSPALLGGAIRPACAPPAALREQSILGERVWQAAGIEPAACRAPQARNRARAGLDARLLTFSHKEQALPRQAVGGCALVRLCGGEERRVSVGARTRALRKLTRRNCLNATSAASEVSFAARPQGEYRSAPCAAGRRLRSPVPAGPMPCIRHMTGEAPYLRTAANSHNGPQSEARFTCRASCRARWSN